MSKVRIGFVGVGGMGQCAHLRNYASLPECEVVAIAELRTGLAARVAQRYGVPRVYASHEEMLAAETLDGIVASQPFSRHGMLVPELLKAGVPVLTEKPIAASIEQGEKVVAAVAASGAWHMVGYHKRSDPATMYAKAEIDRLRQTGRLGRLKYVRVTMPAGDWVANGFVDLLGSDEPYPALVWDPPAADMSEPVRQKYEGFVNYYIHQVNLMRHLLGEPYEATYAEPSETLLAVRSASGVPGVIEMTPYQTTLDWQEQALVAFEHGYVKLDLPAPMASNRPGRVEMLDDPGEGVTPTTVVPTLPWVHAMRQQAMNFVAAIRGERAPLCEAAEALEDLRVARQYIRLLTGE
ncbi:MAG TPA: Gfo/Idh/MocA family oxidoreductase [Chthonomonadales bacterium]|nr:Gfo/Idh/MocA family oxidoreductase [Chthonomonadales bacterium]